MVYAGSVRRVIIAMAKYTTTSMEFFIRLGWVEGMSYYDDISRMAAEEQEAIRPPSGPPTLPSYNVK